jgi:hypothetical protein
MTTTINGSSPSITFSDSTTQTTAAVPLTGGTMSGQLNITAASGQGTPLQLSTTDAGANTQVVFAGARTYQVGTGNSSSGFANALYFYDGTAGAERMRIDSSGNLLLASTTNYTNAKFSVVVSAQDCLGVRCSATGAGFRYDTTANTGYAGYFSTNSNTQGCGTITVSGSSTSYNTSSDYRLKENVLPMTGALDKVSQLKPCTYTWKFDGSAGQGFIAHELQAIVPDAVHGEKDAVNEDGTIKPQGVDTSFLVATLTAAIQELKAEFDAYKASHP